MASVEQITKFDNTEQYAKNKMNEQSRQLEQKFDHWFNTDFLAKSIADKNNDGDIAITEYNSAKEELEKSYEAKHQNEDIELAEIHDAELKLQGDIIAQHPEAARAVTDPFAYAQENIAAKWNREHGVAA